MKTVFALVAVLASAAAFQPTPAFSRTSVAVYNEGPEIGAGGMADTRNPDAVNHEDPRKSISEAPSFEEYLKMRQAEGN